MDKVKESKSSFVNALFFGGKLIIPESETPKAANLTKISDGEQFTL